MNTASSSKPDLSIQLREATQILHTDAEQSGLMSALLNGELPRARYAVMLRNFEALYGTLEHGLARHRADPRVGPVVFPALFRSAAIAADLAALDASLDPVVPLTQTARDYVAHLQWLDQTEPWLLPAHAYVRYMGDLSGGQILRKKIEAQYGAAGRSVTAFYRFDDIDSLGAAKTRFRAGLDALPVDADQTARLLTEAQNAFRVHGRLFCELEANSGP